MTQRSNAGEARTRNPIGSESSTLSLIWNGSGWYGFIGAILASTTDISPVVAVLRLRGLIYHMRVFFSTKARKKYYHMRV